MRRMRTFRPSNELIGAVVARGGWTRDTFKVIGFVHEWARLEAELGEQVGIEAFVAHSVDSRRTCYLRLEQFRAIFADELGDRATPNDLIVWPHGAPERVDVDELGWLPVPA